MIKRIFILVYMVFLQVLFAQSNANLEKLINAYQSFNYLDVINISAQLLASPDEIKASDKIEIYIMSGVANYSLGQTENSRKNFIELLKIDNKYELNPTLISPKIIDFFNNIKNNFEQLSNSVDTNTENIQTTPEEINLSLLDMKEQAKIYRVAQAKSILLPGLGHLDVGSSTKGWFLMTASVGLLSGIIYSIGETNSSEQAYLSETNKELIPAKYDSYNKNYKMRNVLIGAYFALLVYTQVDLLLFNDDLPNQEIISTNKSPNLYNNVSVIDFSVRLRL